MGPGETIDWHFVATGALGVLMGVLAWLGKGLFEDVQRKLSKEEFRLYLEDTARSRQELRDSIIKLFEKLENHEKLDVSRFESMMKDFNGGVTRLSEKMSDNHVQLLTQINGKLDRNKP